MAKKTILFLASTIFLVGCASRSIFDYSVEELLAAVQIEQSDFDTSITVKSINIRQQTKQGSILFVPQIDYENFFLRSYVNRSTKEVTLHQLYVGVSYRGDWRFYQSANLQGGQSLPFTEIDRSVVSCADSDLTGCRLSEDFGITLSDQIFSGAMESGLTLRVNTSSSGIANTYSIPASMFRAQKSAIDRL